MLVTVNTTLCALTLSGSLSFRFNRQVWHPCRDGRTGGALGGPEELPGDPVGVRLPPPQRRRAHPAECGPLPWGPRGGRLPSARSESMGGKQTAQLPAARLCCSPAALRKSLKVLKTEPQHWFYRKMYYRKMSTALPGSARLPGPPLLTGIIGWSQP